MYVMNLVASSFADSDYWKMQNIGPINRPEKITPLLPLVTALCGQKYTDIRDRTIIAF